MAETIQVQGIEEMKRALAAIPEEIATKVLRKSVLAAATWVKKAAIAAAPIAAVGEVDALSLALGEFRRRVIRRKGGAVTNPGTLRRAAIIKFLSAESNATQVEYIVTFRKGKQQQKNNRDAFYAGWVEFGHGGKRAPPHRFLGPAFDANYHQALAMELSTMEQELLKIQGFVLP